MSIMYVSPRAKPFVLRSQLSLQSSEFKTYRLKPVLLKHENLSAARVHFEVRVLPQLIDADQNAAMACGCAQFGAAIVAGLPDRSDLRRKFFR